MNSRYHIGLISKNSGEPVPLLRVHHDITIEDVASYMVCIQYYKNSFKVPTEMIYRFAMTEFSTPHKIRVRLFDPKTKFVKYLDAKVQEKNEAEEKYDDAISEGSTTMLAKQSSTEKNMMEISIGNVIPGIEVKIIIHSILETEFEKKEVDDADKAVWIKTKTQAVHVKKVFGQQMSAEGRSPSEIISAHVRVRFSPSMVIDRLESPSHQNYLSIPEKVSPFEWTTRSTRNFSGEKNFIIKVRVKNFPLVSWISEKQPPNSPYEYSHMCSIVPSFETNTPVKTELYVVLDRSGSMSGSRIRAAIECLKIFFNSLDPESDILFNVISFGSNFDSMFRDSNTVPFNEKNYKECVSKISRFQANYGGTDIYSPLQTILQYPVREGYSRQVFFLSDGEDSQTERIFETVRTHANTTRIFSIGIGTGINPLLIDGIAKRSNGRSIFIENNMENMNEKIMEQLEFALQPCLRDVRMRGIPETLIPVLDDEKKEIMDTSDDEILQGKFSMSTVLEFPVVFNRQRFVRYFFTKKNNGEGEGVLKNLYLEYDDKKKMKINPPSQPFRFMEPKVNTNVIQNEPIDPPQPTSGSQCPMIGILSATHRIQHLEKNNKDNKEKEKEILNLGMAYELVSSKTSFLMVSQNDGQLVGEMKVIRIDPVVHDHQRQSFVGGMFNLFPPQAQSMQSFGGGGVMRKRKRSYSASRSSALSNMIQKVRGGGRGGRGRGRRSKKTRLRSDRGSRGGFEMMGGPTIDEIGKTVEFEVQDPFKRTGTSTNFLGAMLGANDEDNIINPSSVPPPPPPGRVRPATGIPRAFLSTSTSWNAPQIPVPNQGSRPVHKFFPKKKRKKKKESSKLMLSKEEYSDEEEEEEEKEEVKIDLKEVLGKILQCASFQGSFRMGDSKLMKWIKKSTNGKIHANNIREKCHQDFTGRMDVWVTLVVVCLLKNWFKESESVWKLVVRKSRKYLAKNGVNESHFQYVHSFVK